jgi:hypothetical protein
MEKRYCASNGVVEHFKRTMLHFNPHLLARQVMMGVMVTRNGQSALPLPCRYGSGVTHKPVNDGATIHHAASPSAGSSSSGLPG